MKLLYKSITWRIVAVSSSFAIAYLYTGRLFSSLQITISLNVLNAILYYIHEKMWGEYEK